MTDRRQPLDPAKLQQYLDDDDNKMEGKRIKAMERSFSRTMERFDKEAKLFSITEELDTPTANEAPTSIAPIQELPSDEEITQLKQLCIEIDQLQVQINTLQAELDVVYSMGFWSRLRKVFKGF